MTNAQLANIEQQGLIKSSNEWVFVLDRKGSSQWMAKARGWTRDNPRAEQNNPKRMNVPKHAFLAMESYQNMGPGLGNVPTAYIPGAPTYFVNDYVDKDGKLQPGLKTLKYDLHEGRRRACKLGIKFINGVLYGDIYGIQDDKILQEFILHHDWFMDQEGWKRDPRKLGQLNFRRLNVEKEAEKPIEVFETKANAMALVLSLYKQKADKSYEYNTAKIDAILGVFGEGLNLKADDIKQKIKILAAFAEHDSANFLQVWEDAIENYAILIKTAQTKQVNLLTITGKEAKLNLAALENKRVIATFQPGATTESQIETLIFYFMGSPIGRNDWNQLSTEVHEAHANLQ